MSWYCPPHNKVIDHIDAEEEGVEEWVCVITVHIHLHIFSFALKKHNYCHFLTTENIQSPLDPFSDSWDLIVCYHIIEAQFQQTHWALRSLENESLLMQAISPFKFKVMSSLWGFALQMYVNEMTWFRITCPYLLLCGGLYLE